MQLTERLIRQVENMELFIVSPKILC